MTDVRLIKVVFRRVRGGIRIEAMRADGGRVEVGLSAERIRDINNCLTIPQNDTITVMEPKHGLSYKRSV